MTKYPMSKEARNPKSEGTRSQSRQDAHQNAKRAELFDEALPIGHSGFVILSSFDIRH